MTLSKLYKFVIYPYIHFYFCFLMHFDLVYIMKRNFYFGNSQHCIVASEYSKRKAESLYNNMEVYKSWHEFKIWINRAFAENLQNAKKKDFNKRSKCNKTQIFFDVITCKNNVCTIVFIFHDVCRNIFN